MVYILDIVSPLYYGEKILLIYIMKSRRFRGGARRKRTTRATTRNKTPKPWSPRVRGMIALTEHSGQHGSLGRICQVLRINHDKTRIAVRYNYNGQDVVVPYHSVAKAPTDWKKMDPVNHNKEFTNPLQLHINQQLNEY